MILHVKPPLTWLSHWRLSRKTGPLSWNRLRGREKATDRRARAALHARGGGPILEDEEIRVLRMRRRDGLPDQANRRHVNGGLTWRGDFREGGFCDRKRVPRTHLPVLESRRLGVLRDAGSLPYVTGSDAGRARFALPPRACSPLAVYRAARLPGPGGAVVLSQRHARSFPLAAVPLSHLVSAIFIAHNAQSTSRFQIAGPTQNAEAPAVGCGGRFGRKLSGESCLPVARLR